MNEEASARTSERLEPSKRADHPVHRELAVRWEDIDIYGHVNNVVYLSFFDTAVNGWYVDEGLLVPGVSDRIFLVVETGAQYFREIRFGDRVTCGIRTARLGRTSVTYDLALFRNDEEESCARGRYTHVLVNRTARRPVAIDGKHREVLDAAR